MSRVDEYPSRNGGEERILTRKDPVVWTDGRRLGSYSLSHDQLETYEKNGFIKFDGLLKDLVEPLREEFERLSQELEGRPEHIAEPNRPGEARSLFAVHRSSPIADKLSRDPRVLDIVKQFLGEDVYLHQSRINIKPALTGKSFPWHSDFETWHVEDGVPRLRILSAWIMLTENNPLNGPLYVIPGSHKNYLSCVGETPENHFDQSLKQQKYGTPSGEGLLSLAPNREINMVTGPPGTLVFHDGNLMHGSPDNISLDSRTNLFLVYNSMENQAEEPFGGQPPRPSFLRTSDPKPL
ncbi:MAG: phytanoyl-CoA dioxygenase family protein [SAR324 cluster bacterium]|nr:phytanoyl-CoA dioxygenase family protein [SAR324 cluster bacterium]